MTTRMQQRRGTAAEWLSIDPVLAEGELGYETDTGEFRVGDGVSAWSELSPFKNLQDLGGNLDDYIPLTQKGNPEGVATLDVDGQVPASQLANATVDLTGYATETYVNTAVSNLIDAAPGTLDTLNELAAAINDDASYAATVTTALGGKQDKVPGVTDIEIGYLDGVTSTIQNQLDGKAASSHNHLIADITDYTPVDISGKQDKVFGVSDTEIGYLANVTSDIQSQIDSKVITTAMFDLYTDTDLHPSQYTPGAILVLDDNYRWAQSDSSNVSLVTLPTTTSIGDVSATEIGYVAGVTSSIQTQLDTKASTTYVDTAVSNIIDAAPAALDTLNELAAALGDDENFATTIVSSIATKADTNSPTFTGLTDFQGIVDFSEAVVVGIDSLPAQAGNAGKYLSTNGTTASWQEAATQTPHPFAMIG